MQTNTTKNAKENPTLEVKSWQIDLNNGEKVTQQDLDKLSSSVVQSKWQASIELQESDQANSETYKLIALEQDVEKRTKMVEDASAAGLLTAHEVLSLKSTIIPKTIPEKPAGVVEQVEMTNNVNTLSINDPDNTADINNQLPDVPDGTKDPSWLRKQRDWLLSAKEWKEHTWVNVLRAVSGLGIGVLAYKGFQAVRNWFKKRKEKKNKENESSNTQQDTDKTPEKKSWFKRNRWRLVGLWAAAGAWCFFRDKIFQIPYVGPFLDRLFNPNKLSMEQALGKVKSDLNKVSKEYAKTWVWLSRDAEKQELTSYWNTLKIDAIQRKIEGLDVVFPTFEELIHAANIINYSYRTFKGKCENDNPFYPTDAWWDIEVALVNNKDKEVVSGAWIPVWAFTWAVVWSIASIAAGYYLWAKAGLYTWVGAIPWFALLWHQTLDKNDTLSKICPTLNKKHNKALFIGYLNTLPNLTQWKQTVDPSQTSNPTLNETIRIVKNEIEGTVDLNDPARVEQGSEREVFLKDDMDRPNDYVLEAWGHQVHLHIELGANNRIQKIALEDSWVEFKPTWDGKAALKEAMNLAIFTTKCMKEYRWKWAPNNPDSFSFKDWLVRRIPGVVPWIKDKKDWLYFDQKGRSFDRTISKDSIEKQFPTLLQWNNMENYIKRLNTMRNNNNALYWTTNSGDARKSTYANRIMK